MKRTTLQILLISGCFAAASLDFAVDGYMQYYTPLNSLSWEDTGIINKLLFNKCDKDSKVALNEEFPILQNLLQNGRNDYNSIKQILGDPDCGYQDKDVKIERWDLSKTRFLQNYWLRVSFDKDGNPVTWELLK